MDLRRLERASLILASAGEVLNSLGGVCGGVWFLLCEDEVAGDLSVVIESSVAITSSMLRSGGSSQSLKVC